MDQQERIGFYEAKSTSHFMLSRGENACMCARAHTRTRTVPKHFGTKYPLGKKGRYRSELATDFLTEVF